MKKILFAATALAFLVFNSTVFADTKIGVVDLNKILMSSPQLESAKKDLKKKFEKREKAVETAQKKFQGDIDIFSKNAPTMKESEQKVEQQKIIDQQKKLQEMQASLQKDANEAQNKAVGDILKKIEKIINQMATDKKLDLIVAKASLAYNKKELEITDEVVKQLKK